MVLRAKNAQFDHLQIFYLQNQMTKTQKLQRLDYLSSLSYRDHTPEMWDEDRSEGKKHAKLFDKAADWVESTSWGSVTYQASW